MFDWALAGNERLTVEDLLRALMDWLEVADDIDDALRPVRQLFDDIYPADGQYQGNCTFADEDGVVHSFRIELIDLHGPLIAWQRESHVYGFAGRSSFMPGRMAVGVLIFPGTACLQAIYHHALLSLMYHPYGSFAELVHSASKIGAFYRHEASRW